MFAPLPQKFKLQTGARLSAARAGNWDESSPRTHVLVVDGDSLAARVFVRAHVLVDAPVAAPATADAPSAPSNSGGGEVDKQTKNAELLQIAK